MPAPNTPGMNRRERLEMAVPFWLYIAVIVIGLTFGIVVGLTHN